MKFRWDSMTMSNLTEDSCNPIESLVNPPLRPIVIPNINGELGIKSIVLSIIGSDGHWLENRR